MKVYIVMGESLEYHVTSIIKVFADRNKAKAYIGDSVTDMADRLNKNNVGAEYMVEHINDTMSVIALGDGEMERVYIYWITEKEVE